MSLLDALAPLRPAEAALIEAAKIGSMCRIGPPRPGAPSETNTIRPEVVRLLATGGAPGAEITAKGLMVRGAWIDGMLDLQGVRIAVPLTFQDCHFPSSIVIAGAELRDFSLNGSRVQAKKSRAIHGDAVRIDGSLNMRHGFHASGEIRLTSAKISGVFACMGARIVHPSGYALYAAEMQVGGNVYLRDGFTAEGAVTFFGAQIGRDLQVWGATLTCADGPALSVRSAKIGDVLRLRAQAKEDPGSTRELPTKIEGKLDLRGARVGALEDDEATWPEKGLLRIDGFVYGRLDGRSPVAARARKRWLLSQTRYELTTSFRPQPFEHLMSVLRQMGHGEEARRIGVLKERQRARAGKVPIYLRPVHALFGLIVGYGYWTSRALLWSLLFVIVGGVTFDAAWRAGAMAPASDVVLTSEGWRACVSDEPAHPAECWARDPSGYDYQTFEPWLYSVDVFLPVVTFEQEAAWSPSPPRGGPAFELAPDAAQGAVFAAIGDTTIGGLAWIWRYVHEAAGYILSAFAIAGAARLAQREE